MVEHVSFTLDTNDSKDRVRASCLTTHPCARIRRKTRLLSVPRRRCQSVRGCSRSCKSPLACLPEMALPSRLRTQCTLRLPRLLRSTQTPLRTAVSRFESSEDSSSRTSWFCVRGGTPVRSCRCVQVLGFTLALDATWPHFPSSRLKERCVVRLLTGHAFNNDECAVPSWVKTHRALLQYSHPDIPINFSSDGCSRCRFRGHSAEDVRVVARSFRLGDAV